MSWRSLLSCAALPVTSRRWGPPLSAVALGFGLFVGIAISPGAAGTLATGAAPILLEVPDLTGEAEPSSGDLAAGPAARAPAPPQPGIPDEPWSGAPAEYPPPEPAGEPVSDLPVPIAPKSEGEPDEGSEDQPTVLTGTVVHVNPAAVSYTVAEEGGAMSVVHAGRLPAPATEVEVPVRPLANGTLAEAGRRSVVGSSPRATLLGTVTHVSAQSFDPGYVVSARGVSAIVHVPPDSTVTPILGELVTIEVTIEEPRSASPEEADPSAPEPACEPGADSSLPTLEPRERLVQRKVESLAKPSGYVELAAIVVASCPEQNLISLSPDDSGQLAARVPLPVPAGIDVSAFLPGDSVAATATISGESLSLSGIASDERLRGADDAAAAQGDLLP